MFVTRQLQPCIAVNTVRMLQCIYICICMHICNSHTTDHAQTCFRVIFCHILWETTIAGFAGVREGGRGRHSKRDRERKRERKMRRLQGVRGLPVAPGSLLDRNHASCRGHSRSRMLPVHMYTIFRSHMQMYNISRSHMLMYNISRSHMPMYNISRSHMPVYNISQSHGTCTTYPSTCAHEQHTPVTRA
jgi:hypothetical protein